MLHCAELKDRAFITVSGGEARAFLQGLFTIDMLKLAEGVLRYGLLLSPQGRFLHDFFCSAQGDSMVIEMDASRMPDLLARLKLYKLRAKVEIQSVPGAAFALWGEGTPPAGARPDPRLKEMGWRMYSSPSSVNATAEDYTRHRITLGVPEGADLVIDRTLPLEAGLEQLHAVDFDKGCYVGQEVTARSLHRAELRKRWFTVQSDAALPPPGTPVMQNGKPAGEIRAALENKGLAVLQVEAAQNGTALDAGGIKLCAVFPKWLVAG